MVFALVAFISASVLVCQLAYLPHNNWLNLVLPLACYGIIYHRIRIFCSFVLGLVFTVGIGVHSLDAKIARPLQGQPLVIEGYVSSLPVIRNVQYRQASAPETVYKFNFDTVSSPGFQKSIKVSLSWRSQAMPPRPGEKWRFVVKLSRPHGSINTGLFDYEAWLLAQSVSATGSVRKDERNKRLATARLKYMHHQVRRNIRQQVVARLPDDEIRGVLLALMIGESSEISRSVWKVLSNTGTNHLFIISGLHVGLVAGMLLGLFRVLFRLCFTHWKYLAGILAIGLTLAYGALAGFGLPVQRALVMVVVGLFATIMRRPVPLGLIFCYALMFVTICNPFAALGAGYWLSFGAVASLIYVFSGRQPAAQSITLKLIALVNTQWVVFVAMTPLLLCWVMKVSYVSLLVNLLAIPIIALIIVPILLISLPLLLLDFDIASWSLQLAYQLLHYFIASLGFFSELEFVFHRDGLGLLPVVAASVGSAVLLAPPGLVPRWLAGLLFLPLLIPAPGSEKVTLSLSILDVGQGLSVLLRTANHTVVYDAGPAFGNRFDAGEQIVAPAARGLGISKIHTLVISHGDMDHAGGFSGLTRDLDIANHYSSSSRYGQLCQAGDSWWLDRVKFTFLLGSGDVSSNDRSCVLLVETGGFAILLPGDIEKSSEALLTKTAMPFIDLMLVPHHGSLTSSTPAFLNHVKPQRVIVSAGYRNRFNHPHPVVVERYRTRGIPMMNTAVTGQISIQIQGNLMTVQTARTERRRFWYD